MISSVLTITLFTLYCSHFVFCFDPIVLKTSQFILGITGKELHSFLSTPLNWPRIVLSSSAVVGEVIDRPLQKNEKVAEVFGAPPLLPLQVEWICEEDQYPTLTMKSKQGVIGIASDCAMEFTIQDDTNGAKVDFTMRYMPTNPIAILGVVALALDNALAVKVLLPRAIARDNAPITSPLGKFRSLMGSLYCGAGVAHALDLVVGNSKLLTATGIPVFQELPFGGKLLAGIWCVSGPFALLLTKDNDKKSKTFSKADLGLVQYGLVEVGCAACATAFYHLDQSTSVSVAALPNALFVQAIVVASWIYSRGKSE